MATIVDLPVVTRLDVPAERVLHQALEAKLSGVVVIGYQEDGGFYFASSYADGAEVVWLTEYAKAELLDLVRGRS